MDIPKKKKKRILLDSIFLETRFKGAKTAIIFSIILPPPLWLSSKPLAVWQRNVIYTSCLSVSPLNPEWESCDAVNWMSVSRCKQLTATRTNTHITLHMFSPNDRSSPTEEPLETLGCCTSSLVSELFLFQTQTETLFHNKCLKFNFQQSSASRMLAGRLVLIQTQKDGLQNFRTNVARFHLFTFFR